MLKDFKKFIMRGNMIDLAVGVVIGTAFGNTINSLVKDIITPFIGAIAKVPDFSGLAFTINSSKFTYGSFLNNIISFLIISVVIYFFVVLPMNKFLTQLTRTETPKEPDSKKCPECLSDVPINAKRCKFCTSVIA